MISRSVTTSQLGFILLELLVNTGHLSVTTVVVKLLSHVRIFSTPWTVACQARMFMGFSRQ